MRKDKGFALIAVIVVVLTTAIIALAIASYISTSATLTGARCSGQTALAAAQAGIYAAIVGYKADGSWAETTDTSLATGITYSVGKKANFLLVDATKVAKSGSTLQSIKLTNCHSGPPPYDIEITGMRVEWNFIGNLTGVALNNSILWSGSLSSPATPVLSSPLTLSAGQIIGDPSTQPTYNRWTFSTSIPDNAQILVTFIFAADNSSRKALLYNNSFSGNNEFSITATGKAGSSQGWKKTIEATYDITADHITSWQESQDHI